MGQTIYFHGALRSIPLNFDMQHVHFQEKGFCHFDRTAWVEDLSMGEIFLPYCCTCRSLLSNMRHDHVTKKFNFGLSYTPELLMRSDADLQTYEGCSNMNASSSITLFT